MVQIRTTGYFVCNVADIAKHPAGRQGESGMGLFDGKKGLILGVANDRSIAWAIAKQIMDQGGECGFSHLPDRPDDDKQKNRRRVSKCTDDYERAKFLIPMNVNSDDDIAAVMAQAQDQFGRIDFLLHSIAFAEYALRAVNYQATSENDLLPNYLGAVAIIFVSGLNYVGVKFGGAVQSITTILKVLGLLIVVAAAFAVGLPQTGGFFSPAWPEGSFSMSLFALALSQDPGRAFE